MKEEECMVTEEGVKTVVELYSDTTGIRDLEQAAEHIAANALYRIEVEGVKKVVFDEAEVRKLLG
jgi:ATP-dependent Lon protease